MAWAKIDDSVLADIADALREKGANGGSIGKNKFDKDNHSIINAYLAANEIQWIVDSASASARIPCKPNTTYTASLQDNSVTLFRVAITDSETTPSANRPVTVYSEVRKTNADPITVTTGTNSKYIIVQINKGLFASAANGLQVEEGITASNYEPYHQVFKPREMAEAIRSININATIMAMSAPMLFSIGNEETQENYEEE